MQRVRTEQERFRIIFRRLLRIDRAQRYEYSVYYSQWRKYAGTVPQAIYVGESVKRPMKHIRHHDPEVDGGGKLMFWYEVDDASAAIAEIDLCLEIAYRQQCGKTGKNVFPACCGKLEFLRPKLGSISLRKSGFLRLFLIFPIFPPPCLTAFCYTFPVPARQVSR